MGIRIQPRKHKDGRTWRLIIEVERTRLPNGKRKKDSTYPAPDAYKKWGFDPNWSIEQANAEKKRQKNWREQERRAKVEKKIADKLMQEETNIPELLDAQFQVFLKKRLGLDDKSEIPKKMQSHWRAAKKVITDLNIEPCNYGDEANQFYGWAVRASISPSYAEKIFRLVNMWGLFIAKRSKSTFDPIPRPLGTQKQKIKDAYRLKKGKGKESSPLTIDMIKTARQKLREYPPGTDLSKPRPKTFDEQRYRFLFCAAVFGLRPGEVCALTPENKGKTWRIEVDKKGVTLLWVYQSKLVSLDADERFKAIPCLFREQNEAMAWLEQGLPMKRPLVKTIQRLFGEEYNLYGPRKAFFSWMVGDKFIDANLVSLYLGHRGLTRSIRDYLNRQRALYPKQFASKKPKLKAVGT